MIAGALAVDRCEQARRRDGADILRRPLQSGGGADLLGRSLDVDGRLRGETERAERDTEERDRRDDHPQRACTVHEQQAQAARERRADADKERAAQPLGARAGQRCGCRHDRHRQRHQSRPGAGIADRALQPLGEAVIDAEHDDRDRRRAQIGHGERPVARQHAHVEERLRSPQRVPNQRGAEDDRTRQSKPERPVFQVHQKRHQAQKKRREQSDAWEIDVFHQPGESCAPAHDRAASR